MGFSHVQRRNLNCGITVATVGDLESINGKLCTMPGCGAASRWLSSQPEGQEIYCKLVAQFSRTCMKKLAHTQHVFINLKCCYFEMHHDEITLHKFLLVLQILFVQWNFGFNMGFARYSSRAFSGHCERYS